MLNIHRFRSALFLLTWLGVCSLPAIVRAGDAGQAVATQIADVALAEGGVLWGQMVDGQNAPQSGVRVSLLDAQGREVAAAVTDRQGSFLISRLPGGIYQLATPYGRQSYRLWAVGIAPPAAQRGVLLVTPGNTVRGTIGDGSIKNFITNPFVIGGAVGAAIAVPAIVASSNKSPSSP